MGLLSKKPVARQDRLAAAAKARAKGRYAKAIAEYRQALLERPDDPATNTRLAPLLAKVGDYPGAWACFVTAGERFFDTGFVDRAASVYTQAAQAMPWHPKTWKALARMHLARGRRADAFKALVNGRRHLGRRTQRPEAIELLTVARQIDPTDFEVSLDLARLLRKQKRTKEAREVLDAIAEDRKGGELRRVRREYFALAPSLSTAWRWLRGGTRSR